MGCLSINTEFKNTEVSVETHRYGGIDVSYDASVIQDHNSSLSVLVGITCDVDIDTGGKIYLAVLEGRIVTSDNKYLVVTE